MTAENQALLDAIRVVVGEAVAPLTERMDGLTERMDGLTGRMDGLTGQMDGLTGRMDGLTGRMDGLTGRMDRFETEQLTQRGLLESMDGRLTGIESRLTNVAMRVAYLDERYETLEARTSQIAHDLFEMGERIDKSLAALRSDLRDAFHDLVAMQTSQKGHGGRIQALEEKVSELQQRLEKLENQQLSG
jgi:chromosome segregation ATPase